MPSFIDAGPTSGSGWRISPMRDLRYNAYAFGLYIVIAVGAAYAWARDELHDWRQERA